MYLIRWGKKRSLDIGLQDGLHSHLHCPSHPVCHHYPLCINLLKIHWLPYCSPKQQTYSHIQTFAFIVSTPFKTLTSDILGAPPFPLLLVSAQVPSHQQCLHLLYKVVCIKHPPTLAPLFLWCCFIMLLSSKDQHVMYYNFTFFFFPSFLPLPPQDVNSKRTWFYSLVISQ